MGDKENGIDTIRETACPLCGANSGEPCIDDSGILLVGVHGARLFAHAWSKHNPDPASTGRR